MLRPALRGSTLPHQVPGWSEFYTLGATSLIAKPWSMAEKNREEAMHFARAVCRTSADRRLYGCGNIQHPTAAPPAPNTATLTATDVQAVWQAAAASVNDALVIAVVDRAGNC